MRRNPARLLVGVGRCFRSVVGFGGRLQRVLHVRLSRHYRLAAARLGDRRLYARAARVVTLSLQEGDNHKGDQRHCDDYRQR